MISLSVSMCISTPSPASTPRPLSRHSPILQPVNTRTIPDGFTGLAQKRSRIEKARYSPSVPRSSPHRPMAVPEYEKYVWQVVAAGAMVRMRSSNAFCVVGQNRVGKNTANLADEDIRTVERNFLRDLQLETPRAVLQYRHIENCAGQCLDVNLRFVRLVPRGRPAVVSNRHHGSKTNEICREHVRLPNAVFGQFLTADARHHAQLTIPAVAEPAE